MEYSKKLKKKWDEKKFVCVGLDPEIDKIPEVIKKNKSVRDTIFEFNKEIIKSTSSVAAAFKPNSAFYEAEGSDGWNALKLTIDYIHENYPDMPVILDAKRGDIGNTSRLYAKAAFEFFNADAVTVYPHAGRDAIQPFFEYTDHTTIVLIKTSNPDSKMFMDLVVNGKPYYLCLAEEIASWNVPSIGMFVGATHPEEMQNVRNLFPSAPFLTAGVGAQGGNVEEIVTAGVDKKSQGIVFNSSRNILYASSQNDFGQKALAETIKLNNEICQYLPQVI